MLIIHRLYADVYGNPVYRGRAMAWYLAGVSSNVRV